MSEPACPFYVGQRVTPCVQVNNPDALAQGMRYGGVYTITWIGVQNCLQGDGVVCLKFKELTPNRPLGWWWECFKPVTDISSLEALLKTTKLPQDDRTSEHA